MDFYDEVLRELLVAMGGALFVGNLFALLRRRAPAAGSSGSRRRDQGDTPCPPGTEEGEALPRAPVGRTVAYMVIGLVVAFWGLASLLAS